MNQPQRPFLFLHTFEIMTKSTIAPVHLNAGWYCILLLILYQYTIWGCIGQNLGSSEVGVLMLLSK